MWVDQCLGAALPWTSLPLMINPSRKLDTISFLILPTSAFRIQSRHHMEHATTYDTVKLKQAPGMVVHCKRGPQLQSYVPRLHVLTLHPLKRCNMSCLAAHQT